MLSSITPLGQRGRGRSWIRTVVAFWIGATAAGAIVFGTVGVVGSLLAVPSLNPWYSLVILVVAGSLDLAGVKAPGPRRQVDEDWLGRYRDWVVGLGFGAQLGAGFVTIIPSFGTWAMFLLAAGSGIPLAVSLGVAFGIGRSLLLVSTARVRSTPALADTMRRFNGAERLAGWLAVAAYGVVIMVGFYVA
jgi:hypothetical protein